MAILKQDHNMKSKRNNNQHSQLQTLINLSEAAYLGTDG